MALGKPIKHPDHVSWASFSPDSQRVATAGYDQIVRLWDFHTGSRVVPEMHHTGIVKHVEFSPDGSRLAAVSNERTVWIWDAYTGQLIGRPRRMRGGVHRVRFDPYGNRVFAEVDKEKDDYVADWWDLSVALDRPEILRLKAEVETGFTTGGNGAAITMLNEEEWRQKKNRLRQILGKI